MPQQQFKGYSQDQMKRIASKLGHTGDLTSFNNYLDSNPKALGKYNALKDAAVKRYASGGMVKSGYDAGGDVRSAYMANFGREPKPEALAFYTNALSTGTKSLEQINADLAYADEGKAYAASPEGKAKRAVSGEIPTYNPGTGISPGGPAMPPLTPEQEKTIEGNAVRQIYEQSLGRSVGKEGFASYTTELARLKASGLSSRDAIASIRNNIDNSTEAKQFKETGQQRYVSKDAQGHVAQEDTSRNQDPVYDNGIRDEQRVGLFPNERMFDPIQQAYLDNTGRLPNTAGYEFYKNSGKSIEDIKADLAYSDEGKQYAVTKDNESIQSLFKDKLGRFAGQQGQDFYAGKVAELKASGKTSKEALAAIGLELDNSTEGKQRLANPDQQRYVAEDDRVYGQSQTTEYREGGNNRQYTQAGPDYATTDQAVDKLGRTGDNTAADTAAIQDIYQNQVGRAAGTKGADYYADLMAGGTNLDTVRGQIAGSPEAGTYNTTGQQQYVETANRIDGVKYNEIGTGNVGGGGTGGITFTPGQTVQQTTTNQSLLPELAIGAKTVSTSVGTNANQMLDTTKGQVDNTAAGLPTSTAGIGIAGSASDITTSAVNKQGATTATDPTVTTMLAGTNAATGTINDNNKVEGQEQTTSAVSDLNAAQTTATTVEGAPVRSLQAGEEVAAVANAQTAAAFTEQVQAAQADPTSRATVQGQLATLMTSFDEGKTPAWAAGAMRNVTATMAARGIGSSSMAGQALIQAALESALPIATADAQTYASFEMTNLNNKQQRAMLSAQQRATFMGQEFDQDFQARVFNSTRIGEIANLNFSASQQIAVENAQVANTVNLANLSNRQANVMAEAAALSQLEMASLNNLQQAQVQNAKSFLDMDMANLSNKQQTALFKAQSRSQSILSDAAAENARSQFNATSENQTDQFFKTLQSQVSQFNAAQNTAVSQSNAGDATAVSKFNAEVANQRQQFNATNGLIINQSNATWRREIATANTASINRVNEINAKAALDISNQAYDNLWQEYRDEMDWGYQVLEGEAERNSAIERATIAAAAEVAKAEGNSESSMWDNVIGLGASYLNYKDGKTS